MEMLRSVTALFIISCAICVQTISARCDWTGCLSQDLPSFCGAGIVARQLSSSGCGSGFVNVYCCTGTGEGVGPNFDQTGNLMGQMGQGGNLMGQGGNQMGQMGQGGNLMGQGGNLMGQGGNQMGQMGQGGNLMGQGGNQNQMGQGGNLMGQGGNQMGQMGQGGNLMGQSGNQMGQMGQGGYQTGQQGPGQLVSPPNSGSLVTPDQGQY